ncbi:helix-turn-helix domain-containing protein [Nesterenkonia ebinurensis]|uniref:helix-turn-helix domain-containing protein n=1 Tax=Nesterenkonia ebinurensis TaxID=2608252 RepID=UPI001CC3D1EB
MNTKRAAEFLGVPEGTLRSWRHHARSGEHPAPPSFRAGKRVLYVREELEAWVTACTQAEAKAQGQVMSR